MNSRQIQAECPRCGWSKQVPKSAEGKKGKCPQCEHVFAIGEDTSEQEPDKTTFRKTWGRGAGRAADLQYWEKTAGQIAACSTGPKVVRGQSAFNDSNGEEATRESVDRMDIEDYSERQKQILGCLSAILMGAGVVVALTGGIFFGIILFCIPIVAATILEARNKRKSTSTQAPEEKQKEDRQQVYLLQKRRRKNEIKQLQNGILSTCSPPDGAVLDPHEECHYFEHDCKYKFKRSKVSKEEKSTNGTLVITSERVIYQSTSYPFQFSPNKIIGLGKSDDGLKVILNQQKGTGIYTVDNPEKVRLILRNLLRGASQEPTNNHERQAIPDNIKKEVWQRDGGQCVKCGSQKHLEFDHIIPVSKGGSDRAKNLQLLCKSCNRSKSDKIGG